MTVGRGTHVDAVARRCDLPSDRVRFALDELNKKRLVGYAGESYTLYTSALDLLALKHYADRDHAMALGKLIAKGKESDVYEVLSARSELFALKFFRLGRTSFRDVRRKRASAASETSVWMVTNYTAARQEYSALRKLRAVTENIPQPIDQDRHTVLLQELPGVRLSVRPELEEPESVLSKILETERDAYVKAGMINGDLSEYNILTDGTQVWLIDWPQWVGPDHPNAEDLLKRDTSAVLRFFRRTYRVEADLGEVLAYVKGGDAMPELRTGLSSGRGSAS